MVTFGVNEPKMLKVKRGYSVGWGWSGVACNVAVVVVAREQRRKSMMIIPSGYKSIVIGEVMDGSGCLIRCGDSLDGMLLV